MKERYLLKRELGRGGFGTVYLAEDQSTGKLVAVKVLRDPSPASRQRLRDEAITLYRLINNQFIVELLDHDLDAELPYLVLEYCESGSLRAWVEQRHTWQDVAKVLTQVIQGLAIIHSAKGFHRDIKPDNILVGSALGQDPIIIKLADFGLARLPDRASATITRTAGGTNGYIAPEVLGGADYHSGADIYSLGIVATELLTGTRNVSALRGVEIPLRLRELVLAMCSSDSTKRPDTRQIAAALASFLIPPRMLVPASAPVLVPAPAPSPGAALGMGALFAAALVALAALAAGNNNWDATVRRYRGPDGRFK